MADLLCVVLLTHHLVRALKLHSASPRFLFSSGDDSTVLSWDFHHGGRVRDPVEYDRHATAAATGNGFRSSIEPQQPASLQVEPIAGGFLPWNAIDVHAESDTLVAGSDAQSMLIIQNASKLQQRFP